ncbi:MAG: dynamin family protein [Spirochaetota bacterium]
MQTLLQTIKEICVKHSIKTLNRNIQIIDGLFSQNKIIDVAVLGQFKAGKSSFLNSFIGKEILPTGVIPLTSVITRIMYGEKEKVAVFFLDGHVEEIAINSIDAYVSESKNPENIKDVLWVDVELPELKQYEGLRFVDTPGLGSIFKHNSEVTEKWAPEIGVAIVAVSADRPLAENEIVLLKEVEKYSPDIVLLLTKADLFTDAQTGEIIDYINNSLEKSFDRDVPVYSYSAKQDREKYQTILQDKLFTPLMKDFGGEFDKILKYKIDTLAQACLSYLNLSLSVSRKSDSERSILKTQILSDRLTIDFIREELLLLMTNFLSQTREKIFKNIQPYQKDLSNSARIKFIAEYKTWRGNLFKISRKYEKWLNEVLQTEIKKIVNAERPKFVEIVETAKRHYSFFLKSFRDRLNQSIQSVLGITIKSEEWVVEIKEIRNPDVRVSRASDFHLDMLWFLFPMFLYKGVFKKYFANQIPNEIDKNLHRITSDLTGIVNKEIEELKNQTYRFIVNELATIEAILSDEKSQTEDIVQSIELINSNMPNL